MSHTKIAPKILEVIRQIPDEQSFEKLNEALLEQKLITHTEYKIVESRERVATQGIVWQIVTVVCELTIIDTESDEILVNVALGSGVDTGDKAVIKAQRMAWWYAWIAALNIKISTQEGGVQAVTSEPEIIVETPESKLIAHIKALWKWDQALFPDYALQRFKRPIEQLNISELTVLKNELENYGR